jgi:hypothetical protein
LSQLRISIIDLKFYVIIVKSLNISSTLTQHLSSDGDNESDSVVVSLNQARNMLRFSKSAFLKKAIIGSDPTDPFAACGCINGDCGCDGSRCGCNKVTNTTQTAEMLTPSSNDPEVLRKFEEQQKAALELYEQRRTAMIDALKEEISRLESERIKS